MQDESSVKSGLRILEPGDILFNEDDQAESLFIIQRGQLRLFRPKKQGYVELATLRTGEVLGEMAYFDVRGRRRRSCSANALQKTEIIEISFNAFGKALDNLNPWFKTIIKQMVDGLRKSNEEIKRLESDGVDYKASGKIKQYEFMSYDDMVKLLGLTYFAFKNHTENSSRKKVLQLQDLRFYICECFNFPGIKYEEYLQILKNEGFVDVGIEGLQLQKEISCSNVEVFNDLMNFFTQQRSLVGKNRLSISPKCERFLRAISRKVRKKDPLGSKREIEIDISEILEMFKKKNIDMSEMDLEEAIKYQIVGDVFEGRGYRLTTSVQVAKLKFLLPAIRMTNALTQLNSLMNK